MVFLLVFVDYLDVLLGRWCDPIQQWWDDRDQLRNILHAVMLCVFKQSYLQWKSSTWRACMLSSWSHPAGNTMKYIKCAASSSYGNTFSILAGAAWLPFNPLGPIQVLALNTLYNISQLALPVSNWSKSEGILLCKYLKLPSCICSKYEIHV